MRMIGRIRVGGRSPASGAVSPVGIPSHVRTHTGFGSFGLCRGHHIHRLFAKERHHHRLADNVHQHTEQHQPAEHRDDRDQSSGQGDRVDVAVADRGERYHAPPHGLGDRIETRKPPVHGGLLAPADFFLRVGAVVDGGGCLRNFTNEVPVRNGYFKNIFRRIPELHIPSAVEAGFAADNYLTPG